MTDRSPRSARRRPGQAGWRPVPAWRRYLRAGQAEEVLRQIIPGDPLRLRLLAAERVTAAARIVDVDRVVLRAMARIAHSAALHGPPADEDWLVGEMNRSIEEVVGSGTERVVGGGSFLEALAPGAGLEPEALIRSCAAFNRRSRDERVAFWSLMIATEPLEEAADRHETSSVELARRSRRVLAAMLRAAAGSGAA